MEEAGAVRLYALSLLVVVPFVHNLCTIKIPRLPEGFSIPTATATVAPTSTPVPTATPAPSGESVAHARPWAIDESLLESVTGGEQFSLTITDGSTEIRTIAVDAPGSAAYEAAAGSGAASVICSDGLAACDALACPGSYPGVCGETAPECDGPTCAVATGNLVGPTKDGVDFAIANTVAACDTWDEATAGPDGDGYYSVTAACSPDTEAGSLRVIVVPTSQLGAPSADPVTITGFAMFWLDGRGICIGSTCDVELTYIGPGVRW
ncbi:MAG TPA: hypothetical protein VFH62_05155 [Dehalococcoidia bacterium]|nr:hypothetical protein [Dehalococcoidia bacterium]